MTAGRVDSQHRQPSRHRLADLIKKYKGFAISRANRICWHPDIDKDEARSIALLELCRVAQRYDVNGSSFKAFARHRIDGALLDWIREEYLGGRNGVRPKIIPQTVEVATPSALESVLTKEADQSIRDKVARLPRRERELIEIAYLNEVSITETVKMLRISVSRYHQIRVDAFTHLKEMFQ